MGYLEASRRGKVCHAGCGYLAVWRWGNYFYYTNCVPVKPLSDEQAPLERKSERGDG